MPVKREIFIIANTIFFYVLLAILYYTYLQQLFYLNMLKGLHCTGTLTKTCFALFKIIYKEQISISLPAGALL